MHWIRGYVGSKEGQAVLEKKNILPYAWFKPRTIHPVTTWTKHCSCVRMSFIDSSLSLLGRLCSRSDKNQFPTENYTSYIYRYFQMKASNASLSARRIYCYSNSRHLSIGKSPWSNMTYKQNCKSVNSFCMAAISLLVHPVRNWT
jgi:hypothetical protein